MTPEQALIRRILARHGARPELRLWRNEVGVFWAGRPGGRTREGNLILEGASRVSAGLAVGSADLIGIGPGGRFLSVEVKAATTKTTKEQLQWIKVIRGLNGVAGVAHCVGDVDDLLDEALA